MSVTAPVPVLVIVTVCTAGCVYGASNEPKEVNADALMTYVGGGGGLMFSVNACEVVLSIASVSVLVSPFLAASLAARVSVPLLPAIVTCP
jgi:hypothetical protein